jgi:hypothetical protein
MDQVAQFSEGVALAAGSNNGVHLGLVRGIGEAAVRILLGWRDHARGKQIGAKMRQDGAIMFRLPSS